MTEIERATIEACACDADDMAEACRAAEKAWTRSKLPQAMSASRIAGIQADTAEKIANMIRDRLGPEEDE